MKFTAFAVILMGVVIACFAAFQYASGGPPEQKENPSYATLLFPMLFSAGLVVSGIVMWTFGGKGYTVSRLAFWRSPTGNRQVRIVTDEAKV